ncbi:MAG: hypothetical protein AAF907_04615 [Planctomycetota bacterium]
MLTDAFPPAARFVAAAVCLGLAWVAFGRSPRPGEPDRRRPWAVWASGFAAAWLVLAGEGFVFLFSRGAREWLPVVAVGIAGSWFVLRGRRGGARGRRLAGGAVLLMVAAPFLSRVSAIIETNETLARFVIEPLGISTWYSYLIGEALGGVAVLLTAALIAAAAWRPPTLQEGEEEQPDDEVLRALDLPPLPPDSSGNGVG